MSGLETDVGGELDLPKQGNGHGSSFNPPLQKKKKEQQFWSSPYLPLLGAPSGRRRRRRPCGGAWRGTS